MLSTKLFVVLAVLVMAACQSGVDSTNLTEGEKKNLSFVDQENVAMYGGPPLIPANHDFVIGEDIDHFSNGGNDCLDCHNDESEEEATQTTHPERHNCLQCHVPQTEDTSIAGDFKVDNVFTKYKPGVGK